ncbi:YjcQ family protein [Bacillus thuringiensis]|nr:YjcQ family protein [Bacillus thuringiensis]MED2921392.1 YjcQ family protein [Bacillus thuringiensis]MED3048612.1 YjcQ family protein [Bacillus thuringiensis]
MDVKEIVYHILQAINAGQKNITADKLEIDETTFRDLCEWIEDNNWAVGIDCQYYQVDFSNAKVTNEGKNYLMQKSI